MGCEARQAIGSPSQAELASRGVGASGNFGVGRVVDPAVIVFWIHDTSGGFLQTSRLRRILLVLILVAGATSACGDFKSPPMGLRSHDVVSE
jgi:hypothetical protein